MYEFEHSFCKNLGKDYSVEDIRSAVATVVGYHQAPVYMFVTKEGDLVSKSLLCRILVEPTMDESVQHYVGNMTQKGVIPTLGVFGVNLLASALIAYPILRQIIYVQVIKILDTWGISHLFEKKSAVWMSKIKSPFRRSGSVITGVVSWIFKKLGVTWLVDELVVGKMYNDKTFLKFLEYVVEYSDGLCLLIGSLMVLGTVTSLFLESRSRRTRLWKLDNDDSKLLSTQPVKHLPEWIVSLCSTAKHSTSTEAFRRKLLHAADKHGAEILYRHMFNAYGKARGDLQVCRMLVRIPPRSDRGAYKLPSKPSRGVRAKAASAF